MNTYIVQIGHEFMAKIFSQKNIYWVKPENTKLAGNWFNKGGNDRQRNRSKTFEGIAKAIAEQWGAFLLNIWQTQ